MFDFRATIKLAMTDSETPALVGALSSWIYQACQGGPELIPVKARKVNRKSICEDCRLEKNQSWLQHCHLCSG